MGVTRSLAEPTAEGGGRLGLFWLDPFGVLAGLTLTDPGAEEGGGGGGAFFVFCPEGGTVAEESFVAAVA